MKTYFRDRIVSLFKLDDPPHKLALAFALGVFVAFSPTVGLHIASCILLAWIFRVSKLVVLTASFINNPWTIVPLYGLCIWFGIKITGTTVPVPQIAWNDLTITSAYLILKPYLWPYIAGTLILGTIAAIIAYLLFYWAILRYRRLEKPQGPSSE
jgi:uncharacterized protein (DUF2062 family)